MPNDTRELPATNDGLYRFLGGSPLAVAFRLEEHVGMLHRLLRKYRDTPMSLADACVVRMAEIHEDHRVLTLDSDFHDLPETWPALTHAHASVGHVRLIASGVRRRPHENIR